MNEELDEIVKKYSEVYKDKDKKFDKINILLPDFIYQIMAEGFESIDQVRMSNGIFTTKLVDEYFNYIKALYNIDPLKYEEERLKYARKQLNIAIIPETSNKIDEIKTLICTNDRVGVIKNALEHYIKTNNINTLIEPILEEPVLDGDE